MALPDITKYCLLIVACYFLGRWDLCVEYAKKLKEELHATLRK